MPQLSEKSWRKSVFRNTYHIFMIVLLATNTIFLFYHLNDFRIELSETSLILTVVGFFFAFAGINIYSIFNTNVETEKEQLKELADRYRKEIEGTMCMLNYSKKLISYYHYAQMIVSSKKFNSQSLEQITSVINIIEEYKSFLSYLYQSNENKLFEEYKRDFLDVSRGIRDLLSTYFNNGILPKNFFRGMNNSAMEELYKGQFRILLDNMDKLEDYDYRGIDSSNEVKKRYFKQ